MFNCMWRDDGSDAYRNLAAVAERWFVEGF